MGEGYLALFRVEFDHSAGFRHGAVAGRAGERARATRAESERLSTTPDSERTAYRGRDFWSEDVWRAIEGAQLPQGAVGALDDGRAGREPRTHVERVEAPYRGGPPIPAGGRVPRAFIV